MFKVTTIVVFLTLVILQNDAGNAPGLNEQRSYERCKSLSSACLGDTSMSATMREIRDRKIQERKELLEEHQKHRGDQYIDSSTSLSSSSSSGLKCTNGIIPLHGGYPCENVDLESIMGLRTMGCPGMFDCQGSDVWGWVNPSDQSEIAIVGTNYGLGIIDVTDPTTPVSIGFLPAPKAIWQDFKTYGKYLYSVSEGTNRRKGMQVLDLSKVVKDYRRTKRVNNDLQAAVVFSGGGLLQRAHNIAINEQTGFAYIVGSNLCRGGLYMVDIATKPMEPEFVGCYSEDGYTHDVQCVLYDHGPDSRYIGREICFAFNEDTLTIVDVTDKANPVMVSRQGYAGSRYVHQGWLTPDRGFLVVDDELDESRANKESGKFTKTFCADVSDLENPVFMTKAYSSPVKAIDHNQYITPDWYVYQANYAAGLRILDVSSLPTQAASAQGDFSKMVREHGYFVTNPSIINSGQVRFSGAWSVYPWFPSGNVILSSIDQGLFVLKPTNLQEARDNSTKTESCFLDDPNVSQCNPATDLCCDPITCQPKLKGEVCRPASGDCDVEDVCDGINADVCPDLIQPVSFSCVAPGGGRGTCGCDGCIPTTQTLCRRQGRRFRPQSCFAAANKDPCGVDLYCRQNNRRRACRRIGRVPQVTVPTYATCARGGFVCDAPGESGLERQCVHYTEVQCEGKTMISPPPTSSPTPAPRRRRKKRKGL